MAQPERPQLSPPGKRRKPVNLVDLLVRRLVLIAIGGALLAAVLAPLLWLTGGASYTASGTLAIDPGKEPTLNGRERETIPGNVGDYTRTLLSRLTSGDVLLAALQSVPTNQWPTILDPRRPAEANLGRLFKGVKAKEVPRTYLMSVDLTGPEPEGLGPMLNAVLDAFVGKLRRELEQQNERRLSYLRAERDQIVARITGERNRILELAEAVPNKAFLHESYTVHLSKLEQIQRLYWEAEALRAQREGDLRRAEQDRILLDQLSLQPYADERVADNFGINRIEQWTYEQLQSLRSTIDGLTTNNEDRTYVEMRMQAMNDYLVKYKGEVNDLTIRILNEKRDHDLTTEVIKASNALAAARSSSDTLGQRLNDARREASDTSEAIFSAADITFTVSQLRERLGALNNRIDDCEMEAKAPLRVYIDRRSGDPTRPTSNSRPQLAGLGIVLAFGLVLLGVLGFEIMDDRIRGPAEVEAALGGPVPEPLPLLPAGTGLERVLLDHPTSAAGVLLRTLAVRLNRERTQPRSPPLRLHRGRDPDRQHQPGPQRRPGTVPLRAPRAVAGAGPGWAGRTVRTFNPAPASPPCSRNRRAGKTSWCATRPAASISPIITLNGDPAALQDRAGRPAAQLARMLRRRGARCRPRARRRPRSGRAAPSRWRRVHGARG
jgi:succinoglycan biosynthesis transport protein ExoP